MLENIIVQEVDLHSDLYKYMFSVDVVNDMVHKGTSFRDAYKKVGLDIEDGSYQPILDLDHQHEGSMGNLCNMEIKSLMDEVYGMFSFEKMDKALNNLLNLEKS